MPAIYQTLETPPPRRLRAKLRKPNGHDRRTNGVNIDIVKTAPLSPYLPALFARQGASSSKLNGCYSVPTLISTLVKYIRILMSFFTTELVIVVVHLMRVR